MGDISYNTSVYLHLYVVCFVNHQLFLDIFVGKVHACHITFGNDVSPQCEGDDRNKRSAKHVGAE